MSTKAKVTAVLTSPFKIPWDRDSIIWSNDDLKARWVTLTIKQQTFK